MPDPLIIRVEQTPNPNALKFSTNRTLAEGRAQTFASTEQALLSPLAGALLRIDGVKSVFFLRDFASVTRVDGAAWEPIIEGVQAAMARHFEGR